MLSYSSRITAFREHFTRLFLCDYTQFGHSPLGSGKEKRHTFDKNIKNSTHDSRIVCFVMEIIGAFSFIGITFNSFFMHCVNELAE